jgi:hypothetical protein
MTTQVRQTTIKAPMIAAPAMDGNFPTYGPISDPIRKLVG